MENKFKIAEWKRALKGKQKELEKAEAKAKSNYEKKESATVLRINAENVIRIRHEIALLERDIARLESIASSASMAATTANAVTLTASAARLLPPPGGGAGSGPVAITDPRSNTFDKDMSIAFRNFLQKPDDFHTSDTYIKYVMANSTRPVRFKGSELEKRVETEHLEYLDYKKKLEASAGANNAGHAILAKRLAKITGTAKGGRSRRLKSKRNKRTRRHVR